MSALDAGFWDLEDAHTALHIGAVAIFDGSPPSQAEVAQRYASRIEQSPRYRQRMRRDRLRLRRPVWTDDPGFDLDHHLRRVGLPVPGGREELLRFFGWLMSNRLDPDRSLWEAWVLEGLADDQWALATKVHHSMVDGQSGMQLLVDLFDEAPMVKLRPLPDGSPGRGSSRPVARLATAPARATRAVLEAGLRTRRTEQLAVAGVRGGAHLLRALRPTAGSSLSGATAVSRTFQVVTVDLVDVSRIRTAFGGSVNDLALALVTRALRDLLLSREEAPREHTVRCLVPVSLRVPAAAHEPSNRVTAMLVDLPVEFGDIVTTYGAVQARMRQARATQEAEALELLESIADHLPGAVVSGAVRSLLRVPHRVLTTVVTNVRGPASTVHLLGRPMAALYPYVPIADTVRVGVAVTSYAGRLQFGITCDRDSVPDASVLVDGIDRARTGLVKAADAAGPSPS
jgi:diacylglycerol O-acyltransferase